jgi:hypothetical protein
VDNVVLEGYHNDLEHAAIAFLSQTSTNQARNGKLFLVMAFIGIMVNYYNTFASRAALFRARLRIDL